MEEKLHWSITSAERREQFQMAFKFFVPLILILTFLILSQMWIEEGKINFEEFFFAILFVILGFFIVFVINKFFPYKERTYVLDSEGLTITKGKKKKRYFWNEFECFYQYDIGMIGLIEKATGGIFYLKKKKLGFLSKFYKTFVIVYSKPENREKVASFLRTFLPEGKSSIDTQIGLIFYEFK